MASTEAQPETIVPPSAGTREEPDQNKGDFNKEKLTGLTSMFEQKKQPEGQPSLIKAQRNKAAGISSLMGKFSEKSSQAAPIIPSFNKVTSATKPRPTSNSSTPTPVNAQKPSTPSESTPKPEPTTSNPSSPTPTDVVKSGTKEEINYKPTISLKSAMAVFQQDKPNVYQPKNNLKTYKYQAKVNTTTINTLSSPKKTMQVCGGGTASHGYSGVVIGTPQASRFTATGPGAKASNSGTNSRLSQSEQGSRPETSVENAPEEAGSSEVVRNADKLDDRPKTLTTSLNDARSMFENNSGKGNAPTRSVPIATWEGKNEGSSIMKSAKSVFSQESGGKAEAKVEPKAAVIVNEEKNQEKKEEEKVEEAQPEPVVEAVAEPVVEEVVEAEAEAKQEIEAPVEEKEAEVVVAEKEPEAVVEEVKVEENIASEVQEEGAEETLDTTDQAVEAESQETPVPMRRESQPLDNTVESQETTKEGSRGASPTPNSEDVLSDGGSSEGEEKKPSAQE